MTHLPRKRARFAAGLTLLEASIVVAVLLSLMAICWLGTNAWKGGADRASCIVNIRNVQQAVRCYQHMHGYDAGETPRTSSGSPSISQQLYDREFLSSHVYSQVRGTENCPGGGNYSVGNDMQFPETGAVYLSCSLAASDQHRPEIDSPNW